MNQRLNQLAALLVVGGSLWLLWSSLASNDEKRIRALLRSLGRTVSVDTGQSNLSRLAQGSALTGFFTEDLMVTVTHPGGSYRGTTRSDALAQIKRIKISPDVDTLSVSFSEVEFDPSGASPGERQATVTIEATLNGEPFWLTDRFRFVFRKDEERAWRIAVVEQFRPDRL